MTVNLKASAALSAVSLALVSLVSHTSFADDQPTQTDVFVSGTGGYHGYRIPAVIPTPNGTLLAFFEGRKSSHSDHGDLDLVLSRSTNNGKTYPPTNTDSLSTSSGEYHCKRYQSELARRFREDLILDGKEPKSVKSYLAAVSHLAEHYG